MFQCDARWRRLAVCVQLLALVAALASCELASDRAMANDDSRVASLSTKCEEGDYAACDELAADPSGNFDSVSLGATCGGVREQPDGSCSDLLASSTTSVEGEPGCLAKGDTGDAVRDLQQRLNAAGATPLLEVDGIFGPMTESAVAVTLDPTGQVCDQQSSMLDIILNDFTTVPDVRRVEAVAAREELTTSAGFSVEVFDQCSASIEVGKVVTVSYVRSDGAEVVVFDADRPTNSATTLAPQAAMLDVGVSTGICPAG